MCRHVPSAKIVLTVLFHRVQIDLPSRPVVKIILEGVGHYIELSPLLENLLQKQAVSTPKKEKCGRTTGLTKKLHQPDFNFDWRIKGTDRCWS